MSSKFSSAMGVVFYQVFRYLNAPVEGLCATIRLGGDIDTIAAMVGGALFSVHGARAVPEIWKNNLVVADELTRRGQYLLSKGKQDKPSNLVQKEKKWTLQALKSVKQPSR